MALIICILLTILTTFCIAQDYISIDDIPIESYDHGDHQENDMDLELLPARRGRTFFSQDDPKEYFLRSIQSFDVLDDVDSFEPYQNIPRPYFQTRANDQDKGRKKRHASISTRLLDKRDTLSGIVQKIGKPLEVVPMETRNLTEKEDNAETRMYIEDEETSAKGIGISDFIRFRRSTNDNHQIQSRESQSDHQKNNYPPDKLVLETSGKQDINLGAHETTKQHWVKQVYPVRKSDELSFDQNIPASRQNVREPRVHFVTQTFLDSRQASSEPRLSERELPPRHPYMELSREMPRDIARENERSYHYDGVTYMPPDDRDGLFREQLYPRFDERSHRSFYRPSYKNYDNIRNGPPSIQNSQKRIIYYATLPEISRSPPNVNLRDRYRYGRDRFDVTYLNDPYRYSKSYPKSRYEDEGKNHPYPVKVLTDVNVKEVKKNPERRIYSEVDRTRYAYNTPLLSGRWVENNMRRS